MDKFRITGPSRLEGEIQASGAKNAALPALAATLLTDETVELTSVPLVRDTRTMSRLLEALGKRCTLPERPGEDCFEVAADGDQPVASEAPYDLVKTMRASILVLGPLLARTGRARVSLPGGCAIGVRPIDQHLAGLAAMGAEITIEHGYVEACADRLRGCDFELSTPSVTGTENLMMAAALASGTTRLSNCAREPEITDLARLLRGMGAEISGAGTETIEIEGAPSLRGARHRIVSDRIECGTYLIGGAMTGGDVTVRGARSDHLETVLTLLEDTGAEVAVAERSVRVRGNDLVGRDIVTAPYPGFPTDLQAQYVALATQARGVTTVCETVFENRFQHVPELARMGADIAIEGRFARVRGGRQLSGANVMATDLRASACLVLAALCARGVTVVDRVYHLDRGYQEMELKLQHLGARVERLT